MSDIRDLNQASTWVIKPHRSLTWVEAKQWLWLISLVPATSGALFCWFGAPLVLPFAGLEIALIWAAFYWVIREGEHREVVKIHGDSLIIEKGRHAPTEKHTFPVAWVRVDLEGAPYRWHPSRLYVRFHAKRVALGSFLTDGERAALALSLINALEKTR